MKPPRNSVIARPANESAGLTPINGEHIRYAVTICIEGQCAAERLVDRLLARGVDTDEFDFAETANISKPRVN